MDLKCHKMYQEFQESHWWFRVRDNLLKDIAKKYWKPNSHVLDFGCNYGSAVKMLNDLGYDTFGVDVSEYAIEHGRSNNIKNIFVDKEKVFPPESFDAVISLDVLEHIEDDKSAFARINSILKPGGIIVVMVPTFMFLWGVQDETAQHFRRYTLPGLIKVSSQAGNFEIIKKSYFNTFLFLPIAVFRLISRLFNIKSRDSDNDINNRFLNAIFFQVFDLERKLLRYVDLPFGVSALLILRKM